MSRVPAPPTGQAVILPEDLQRLELWANFFTKLSWRLEIIRPNDERFPRLLIRTERMLREEKSIDNDEEIRGWPTERTTAFALLVDSSPPNLVQRTVIELHDTYFFCFDDVAFGAGYFEWDGDSETDPSSKSYSLDGFTSNSLSWKYVCSLIVRKVEELEKRVPPAPQG